MLHSILTCYIHMAHPCVLTWFRKVGGIVCDACVQMASNSAPSMLIPVTQMGQQCNSYLQVCVCQLRVHTIDQKELPMNRLLCRLLGFMPVLIRSYSVSDTDSSACLGC